MPAPASGNLDILPTSGAREIVFDPQHMYQDSTGEFILMVAKC